METVKNFLLNLFFPKFCYGCQKEGTYLCQDCQSLLDIIEFHKPYKTEYLDDLYFPLEYSKNSSSLKNKLIRKLIKKFKYKSFVKDLSKPLTDLIIAHFKLSEKPISFIQNKKDFVIVPVPLNEKKLKWRGFNQSREIAKRLSQYLNIPLSNNILIKQKETPPQSQLNKKERLKNLSNVFYCKKEINKKVLLIDDIYTTGTTLDQCAKKLKKSKAKKVIGITIARTKN